MTKGELANKKKRTEPLILESSVSILITSKFSGEFENTDLYSQINEY